ncbi:MAG: OB-fold nucleic acid binding domain-containing protein [Actinomycetota bacterium]
MTPEAESVTPVSACAPGSVVEVSGVISSVCVPPREAAPTLEIEVSDDTGRLTVVWLGRRAIPGIEAGRRIIVRGRLTHGAARLVIYNPTYRLRPHEVTGG